MFRTEDFTSRKADGNIFSHFVKPFSLEIILTAYVCFDFPCFGVGVPQRHTYQWHHIMYHFLLWILLPQVLFLSLNSIFKNYFSLLFFNFQLFFFIIFQFSILFVFLNFILNLFLYLELERDPVHSSTSVCPVYPAPFLGETRLHSVERVGFGSYEDQVTFWSFSWCERCPYFCPFSSLTVKCLVLFVFI